MAKKKRIKQHSKKTKKTREPRELRSTSSANQRRIPSFDHNFFSSGYESSGYESSTYGRNRLPGEVFDEDERLETIDEMPLKEFLEILAMFDEALDEDDFDDFFDNGFDEDEYPDFEDSPQRRTVQFSTDDICLPDPVPRPSIQSGALSDADWDEWAKKRLGQKKKIIGRRNGETTVDGMNQEEFRTYFMSLALEMDTDSYTLLERLIDYSFGFGADNLFKPSLTKVIARAGDDQFVENAQQMLSRILNMSKNELERCLLTGTLFQKDLEKAARYLLAIQDLSPQSNEYEFYLMLKMVYEAARGRFTPARKIGQKVLSNMKKRLARFIPPQMVSSWIEESSVYFNTDFLMKVMNYIENPNPHLKKQINKLFGLPPASDLSTSVYTLMVIGKGDLLESDMLEPDNQKRFLRFYKSEQTAILLQNLVDKSSTSDEPLDLKELKAYLKELEKYANMRESYSRAAYFFEAQGMEKEAKTYWRKTAQLPCDRTMNDLEVRSDINQRFNALQKLGYKESTIKKYLRESEKELKGNMEGQMQLDLLRQTMKE